MKFIFIIIYLDICCVLTRVQRKQELLAPLNKQKRNQTESPTQRRGADLGAAFDSEQDPAYYALAIHLRPSPSSCSDNLPICKTHVNILQIANHLEEGQLTCHSCCS